VAEPSHNPQNFLHEEILAEARRESEQIVGRARQEAGVLLAKASTEAEKTRQERLDLARAEAVRRKELILSTVPVEANRMRSARIEALLQCIHDEARRRLLARGFDYRECITVLAADAVSRMAGNAFVVKLSPSDHRAMGNDLAGEIAGLVGRSLLTITISDDPTISESGLIIQDAEGRQVWDNRLPARLERLWPELRRKIAIHTGLVSGTESAGGGA
jgi:vacuolar-type H+-ATPase subunit E/Vma4